MHIFFKITLTKISNANIYMYNLYIYFEIILNKRFLVSNTQDLYCQELVFCKWVNSKNRDIGMKVRMKS